MFSAIRYVMPDTNISGCYFHLRSNLRKQVQDKGLVTLFNDSNNFRKLLKRLAALAFVPIEHIYEVFDEIMKIYRLQEVEWIDMGYGEEIGSFIS